MSTCFLCKGKIENQLTTFMVDLGNCIVIVRNVPSQVCTQCGETSYTDEVAEQLEHIVNSVRNSMTEITVVNYHSAA
ncbi:type II toxin-antitoxin system MqsA family antitoxin [Megasphaera sp.]|jgi:YgiT-type zinc finger domain-containing protein|uniref:type II toxin-antitoxin system MqsA family antitoxin n=1 Tax=Megasphaera sp. TaxID=2023260 RepID=UPI003459B328